MKARAAPFQLDFCGAPVICYPNTKVIAVSLEAEAIIALLPPVLEPGGKRRPGRLEQDGALALILSDDGDLSICRAPLRIGDSGFILTEL